MTTELFAEFDELLSLFAFACLFVLIGISISWLYQRIRLRGYQQLATELLGKAQEEAEALRQHATLSVKQELLDKGRELDAMAQAERMKLQREADRLQEREDKLDKRLTLVEKKLTDLERRELALTQKHTELEAHSRQIALKDASVSQELERIAHLSSADAKLALTERLLQEVRVDTADLTEQLYRECERTAESKARTVLVSALNRLAVPCVSEATITTVAIPGDELKARIIGREGRNIRHLERLTGVNFLIDDTPGAVVISGFDPIRRQVAKVALSELVQDGRIHPTRIEEAVEKARYEVERQIIRSGEDTAARAGVLNLHPELTQLLGRLKLRTSYGQNVLEHSLEVSHLMGLMAAELGLDSQLARRIGLLHDVGKAVTHEVEGSHAVVGYDLARRHGEDPRVANGIGCHHGEMPPETVEGSLCAIADALSAARPGARVEAIEEYLKRLRKLEEIALGFAGVERAYAMQAGREVQVSVLPDAIDDNEINRLSRDIARSIEKELSYPGKIKVTVVRERRVTQYAL